VTRLATCCVAVIALHVVDDNFVQPQPGAAAGDHLVSGLVPLVLLALAATAYRREHGARCAAVALVAGIFGVVAGVEAAYYTINGGPSGDDYTGLAALAAGVTLIAVAGGTFWRTRRMDGSRRRRYLLRAAIAVAAAVIMFAVALPLGVAYIGTHVGRLPATRIDFGPIAETVTFTTSDGVELAASYIPSRNRAAVIAFPGRSGPQAHARMLARHGYGVLLVDQRGDGESEGDPNALGWDGEKDIMAAVAYLKRRPDVDPRRIGGIGLSVGGEILLQAAAHTEDLRAVVSEGAGSRSVGEELERGGADKWLGDVQISAVLSAGMMVFSNHLPPPHLNDLVPKIAPRSIFLIYTTHGVDTEDLNPEYLRVAHEPKRIWKIPEASHTGGIEARPHEYERRVVRFFDHALLGPPTHRAAS
jgi:uncharacterized protein